MKQHTRRSVRGDEKPEHMLAGKSMAEVINQTDLQKPSSRETSLTARNNESDNIRLVSMRILSPAAQRVPIMPKKAHESSV